MTLAGLGSSSSVIAWLAKMRLRLDVEMTRRGLAGSREAAQRLILAGLVRVDSRPADKPDRKVGADSDIEIVGARHDYASRGAYKLLAALEHFGTRVEGRCALDVGASTGGFTDVLLRRGARAVVALDVGYGQLALRLRNDPRVVVMERTNIRHVSPEELPFKPELVTIDASFISLKLVLPAAIRLAAPSAEIIALVKPQFEVGKGMVGRGGVVRDDIIRLRVLEEVLAFARELALEVVGSLESPIAGPAGNREFLALMRIA